MSYEDENSRDHLYEAGEVLDALESRACDPDAPPAALTVDALATIAQGLIAIGHELRRSNEDRDRFYREVLGVLTQAKAAPPKQCWKTKRGPQPVVGEAFVYRCVLELGHDGKCTDGERMEWN